jgi:flavin reductase (DIM6/NTAB) family NADH-FMN oxidoreductase RutF
LSDETQAAVDPRLFRQALGQFPTGVCIVTATTEGENLGMTMSSFNSLSLEPPLVLFSVDRRAASLPLWEQATNCAINVLTENQKDISNRFAKPRSNKWEGVRFDLRHPEAPALRGVAAVFHGAIWAKHDGGDHRLFIVEVMRFSSCVDRKPLVFCNGRYATLRSAELAAPLWPLDIHY